MRIVNFGQVVDLEHGRMGLANQFTVELENGQRASVTTDDRTIQQLLDLASGVIKRGVQTASALAGEGTEVKHFEPEEDRQEPEATDEEMAAIFGGNGESDPGELGVEAPDLGQTAESKLVPVPTMGGLGSGKPAPVRRPMVDKDGFALPVHSRTVEKDEMGYPIVERRGQALPPDDSADDGTQI